jgi:hypothetical protein
MRIIPRNFVKKIFWSSTISLVVFSLLGIGSLGSRLMTYFMLMAVLVVIFLVTRVYSAIKNRLAESKLKDGFKRYTYNKRDFKVFDKKVGFFSLIFKTMGHTWKNIQRNDEVEHVVRLDNELLIQYPVNPNVSEGDRYHVQTLSVDGLINQDKKQVVLQGYCYEMKRIYNFEIDKIQQAFDFPSGLPVDISSLLLRK